MKDSGTDDFNDFDGFDFEAKIMSMTQTGDAGSDDFNDFDDMFYD